MPGAHLGTCVRVQPITLVLRLRGGRPRQQRVERSDMWGASGGTISLAKRNASCGCLTRYPNSSGKQASFFLLQPAQSDIHPNNLGVVLDNARGSMLSPAELTGYICLCPLLLWVTLCSCDTVTLECLAVVEGVPSHIHSTNV